MAMGWDYKPGSAIAMGPRGNSQDAKAAQRPMDLIKNIRAGMANGKGK